MQEATGPGRMDDRLELGVVEIEHVARDAVQQRRVQHVEALGAAEHGGARRAGELA